MEQKERDWQLCLKYKKLFNTPDGREILEDLKKRFGFSRSSCPMGIAPTDAFHNEGMKEPIRHIEAQLARVNKDQLELPKEATSAKLHD